MDINNQYVASLLSQAVYAKSLLAGDTGQDLLDTLINSSTGAKDMTEAQAQVIADKFVVVAQQENTDSGFSGTFFQEIDSGEFYFSIRGSESLFSSAFFDDWADANINNGVWGAAQNQIIDMINFYFLVSTPLNQQAPQFIFETVHLPEPPSQPQPYINAGISPIDSSLNTYQIISVSHYENGTGEIGLTSKLHVSGHSLGGHLASAFTLLLPQVIDQTNTQDSAGFVGNRFDDFANLFSRAVNLDGTRNMSASDAAEGQVSNIAAMYDPFSKIPGGIHLNQGVERIEIEVDETLTNLASHSIDSLNDSLAVASFISQLDSSLTIEKYNELFNSASHELTASLEDLVNNFLALKGLPEIEHDADKNNDNVYVALNTLLTEFGIDENDPSTHGNYQIESVDSGIVGAAQSGDKAALIKGVRALYE